MERDNNSGAVNLDQDQEASTANQESTQTNSAAPESPKTQFGIAALFWATFLFGLTLAYLQRLDSPDVLIDGFFAILLGVIVGAIYGFCTGRMRDGLFWSTLVAAFAYVSTASDPVYISYHRMAWAAVGAVTGGAAATLFQKNNWANAMVCAFGAGIVMVGYYSLAKNIPNSADLTFDLYGAPLIGVAAAAFVRIILWLEKQQSMPRYITATWLMAAVIIGNVFA